MMVAVRKIIVGGGGGGVLYKGTTAVFSTERHVGFLCTLSMDIFSIKLTLAIRF